MSKRRESSQLPPQTCFAVDKNLSAEELTKVLPGKVIDAKTTTPKATYKGSNREDEDYYHILQLAFEREACVVTSDYAMIGKARTFHGLVMGHSGGRCMNGVIVVPDSTSSAARALESFRAGKTRVKVIGYKSKPFFADFFQVDASNLGVNLRATPTTVVELCDCPFTN
jgi:hypothetical protein